MTFPRNPTDVTRSKKSANERAAQDVDVNIAAKFGGANCLSGHSDSSGLR